MWGYINRILGQPSLIRESSMAKFPFSGLISRITKKSLASSSGAASESGSSFENIILHPSLKRRIEQLARATANTKSHDAPFRNMLFYGPPGTGKTLVAREMARKSVKFESYISFLHFSLYFLQGSCADLMRKMFLFACKTSGLFPVILREFCCLSMVFHSLCNYTKKILDKNVQNFPELWTI